MNSTHLAGLDRDALIAPVLRRAAIIETPRAEIEILKRSAKRSAAPFAKGTLKRGLKKPGRKPTDRRV